MRRILLGCLAAFVVVAAPGYLAAQDGKRPERGGPQAHPERPNPEALFQRLDVKHEGVIRLDKLPANLPDRLKELLKRADANHDGKVTREEFVKAFDHRQHGPRPEAGQGPQHHQFKAPSGRGPDGRGGPKPSTTTMAKGPHAGGPGMPAFDPKAIFNRLDTNHDGKLSFDEFAAGLRQFHQMLAQRMQGRGMPGMAAMRGQGPNVTMKRMGPNVKYFALFADGQKGCDGMKGHAFAQRGGGFQGQGNYFLMQHGGPRDGFQAHGNYFAMQRGGFNRGGPQWAQHFGGGPQCMRGPHFAGDWQGMRGRGPMPGPYWMAQFQGRHHHHHHGMDGYACQWDHHHGMGQYAGQWRGRGGCQGPFGRGGFADGRGFRGPQFGGPMQRPGFDRGYGFGGPMMQYPGFDRGFGGERPQWDGPMAQRSWRPGWDGDDQGPRVWISRDGRDGQPGPGWDGYDDGPRGPQAADGHQRRHQHADGQNTGHPGARMPAHRQPAADGRADDDRMNSIEARLAALEEQQAATLAMVQEEHTAVMAALEKTNELLTVKLAQMDWQQEQLGVLLDRAADGRGVREVARADRNSASWDRGWDDEEDRD